MFSLKVAAGCVNLFFHRQQYLTNDVDSFYFQSIHELKLLNSSVSDFFNSWLLYWENIHLHLNFLNPENGVYWSNLGNLFHVKFMTLANLFSLGHIYTNVIIYNVVFFLCQLLLFKALFQWQPGKKYLFLISIFLVPSVLFWCSGMHKDGWILSAYCLIVYGTLGYERNKQMKMLLWIVIGMLLLLVVRYFYFVIFLAPYIIYLLAKRFKWSGYKVYTAGMILLLTLFYTLHYIHPKLNFMKIVSHKQKQYFLLRGYSDMDTPLIEDHMLSYVKNAPNALNHILLRPYFWENPTWKYFLSAIDSIFIVLSMAMLLRFATKKGFGSPIACFMLTVGFLGYMFIGYTIPNAGALVRYKSEFTALLLTGLVLVSDVTFEKMKRLFGFK